MFKRLAKRREKRERDEELGLDEEAKQMLGLQDTDSDESSSSSDSGLDSGSNSAAKDGLDTAETDMRTEWLPAGDEDSGLEDESDEGFEDGDPPISLANAIKEPIYRISPDRNERRCIVCPRKILKTDKMVEVHCFSAAHTRRFTKFRQLSESPDRRSSDPRHIVAAISQKASTDASPSNRGLKRKQKLEAIKQKREKTKRFKKKKHEQKQKESPRADGGKRKIGDTDVTDEVSADSRSDKQTSGRSGKRRKVAADEISGQKDSDDRGELANPERKPGKKMKKTKVKPSAIHESTEKTNEREYVEPTQTLSGEKAATTRSDGDLTRVRIYEDSGTKSPLVQKRDRKGIKRKRYVDWKGDMIFAVKEKKRGKPQTKQKNSGRKFSADAKKSARYFDGPEDRVGGNGPKHSSAKMSKTQAKRLKRAAKRDGVEHVSSNWREKAAGDLVIFD